MVVKIDDSNFVSNEVSSLNQFLESGLSHIGGAAVYLFSNYVSLSQPSEIFFLVPSGIQLSIAHSNFSGNSVSVNETSSVSGSVADGGGGLFSMIFFPF